MVVRITGKYASTDSGSGVNNPGGASARAEGVRTKASGISAHAEGYRSNATGNYSHAEGYQTTASWGNNHAEGYQSTADGQASHAQGRECVSSGYYSHADGYRSKTSRVSQRATGAYMFGATGDAQVNMFPAAAQTVDATPKVMTFDNAGVPYPDSVGQCNVLTIPINRAHHFTVSVVARRQDVSGEAAGWQFTGLVARGATGAAAFVGAVMTMTWCTTNAAGWDVTPSIDTSSATNNYLKLTATGLAGQTIRWVARIDTAEVG